MDIHQVSKKEIIEERTSLPFYCEEYSYEEPWKGDFHTHDFYEAGILLSGHALHRFSGQTRLLGPGDAYLIPIGEAHALECSGPLCIQNVYFLPRLLLKEELLLPGSCRETAPFLFLCLRASRPLSFRIPDRLFPVLTRLLDSCRDFSGLAEESSGWEFCQNNCLLNLFFLLARAYFWDTPALAAPDDRMIRLLLLVNRHPHLPTRDLIRLLSDTLKLNPQYLGRLVKSAFDCTLSGLILETKLEKSCGLLLEGRKITEIAQELAFFDHAHYTKYFQRYFGISPTEYRARHLPGKGD